MTAIIEELEQVAARAAEEVGPATVSIGRSGRGSGVVVAPDRVLTNAHNLRDRTTSVTFGDGRSVQGTVTAADTDVDLVVLEVDTASLPPVAWSDELPGIGAPVVAVARGRAGLRAATGFVSGVERSFRGPRGRVVRGAVEHTAPMGRGSSGGALVDAHGRVAGLNTHRLGEGFYLAQPADDALRRLVDALAEGRAPARVELGVAVAPAEVARRLRRSVGLEDRAGALVRAVTGGGSAEAAGVRSGDLVVGVDGTPVADVDDLHAALRRLEGDRTFEVQLVRGAEELTVTVDPTPG